MNGELNELPYSSPTKGVGGRHENQGSDPNVLPSTVGLNKMTVRSLQNEGSDNLEPREEKASATPAADVQVQYSATSLADQGHRIGYTPLMTRSTVSGSNRLPGRPTLATQSPYEVTANSDHGI